jgi:hypothetical protein
MFTLSVQQVLITDHLSDQESKHDLDVTDDQLSEPTELVK